MTKTSTTVLRELSSLWDDLLLKISDKMQEINDLLKEKQLDGLKEKNIKLALGLFLAKANLSNESYKIRFLSAVRDLLCVFEKNAIGGGTFDFNSDFSFMVNEINLHYNKFMTQFEF